MPFGHDFTLSVTASSSTTIAASQIGTASTALTLNGLSVTNGVATLSPARRVTITSAGNDSTNTFTITGTDYYGRTQTEALAGTGTSTAVTQRDFLTVTSIIPTNNTAAAVTAGTNGTASTPPYVVDQFANPNSYGIGSVVTGSATYTVESAFDNLFPNWDLNANTATWYALSNTFNSATTSTSGIITGPFTMMRTTVTSGTGSVIVRVRQSFIAGRG